MNQPFSSKKKPSFLEAKNTKRLKINDKFFLKPSYATALEPAAKKIIVDASKQVKSAEIIAIAKAVRIVAKLPWVTEDAMERKEVCAIVERAVAVVNTVIVSLMVVAVDPTAVVSIVRTNDSSLTASHLTP